MTARYSTVQQIRNARDKVDSLDYPHKTVTKSNEKRNKDPVRVLVHKAQ